MNKNLSILGVSLLLLCMACKQDAKKTNAGSDTKMPETTGLKVAYIDLDSMQNGLDYFKTKRDEFLKEEEAINNELDRLQREIQNGYASFQSKIKANNISQADAEATQKRLAGMEMNYQKKQASLGNSLMKKQAEFNEGFSKLIDDFFKEYSVKHQYDFIYTQGAVKTMLYVKEEYNITTEATKELNEWINSKKADQLLMKTLSNQDSAKKE